MVQRDAMISGLAVEIDALRLAVKALALFREVFTLCKTVAHKMLGETHCLRHQKS